ncbi:3-keto-disaccharide hydrolase [Segetibacter aerophilus]|uniref:3-keto-alpha-glucoside-1,2-lyase/3-keto-2-hydroxy-glucal hydratase domain-containing protein n=1 Tax=Segetibacter aerophilus TaxID=670293 RepID=A0A512BDB3_9BACT|nr:DUF1080 domain-containing protein [Segetibacter aerophilus]GEO09956.1 hypothetical protein SAE01_24520 [Segetibacter aerophilus]
MKYLFATCLLLVSIVASAQKKSSLKWVKLFNGKDLKDWKVKIKDHPLNENFGNTFRVENGVMQVRYDQYDDFKEQYGHIFYKKKFSAYLLVIEYRFVGNQVKGGPGWATRNSGAMLHCQSPESMFLDQDFPISMEDQLLGGNGKDERSTCNLCTPGTNVFLKGKLFTPHCVNSSSKTYHGDQWVRAEALVLGDSIIKQIVNTDTVMVYGKPQYDGNDRWVKKAGLEGGKLIKEGFISLQSESHPCEFRKVELFDLQPYINNPKKLEAILQKLSARKS